MTRRAHQTRLPVEPLIRAAGAENLNDLGAVLGIPPSARRLRQWKAQGGIPYYTADSLAARLGMHPAQVWPEWWNLPDYQDGYVHPSARTEGAFA